MSSLADFYGIASSAPEEATVDDAAVAAAEAKKARESKVALESEQFDSQVSTPLTAPATDQAPMEQSHER